MSASDRGKCRAVATREEILEKGRINLCAAIELGADVIQINGIGQGILGDDINIAAIKVLVLNRLATVRNKALAKNHVSGAKAARIRAAKENGIARHLGINHHSVGPPGRLVALLGVISQPAIGPDKWRSEHIVAKPIAEPVIVLFAMEPMGKPRIERHGGKQRQSDEQRRPLPIDDQPHDEGNGARHQNQIGKDGQAVLIFDKSLADPVRQIAPANVAVQAQEMFFRWHP